MISIVGPRGVGKTTMLLQYIKQHHTGKKSLYVSADNTYFTTHTLIELVDEWANGGPSELCLQQRLCIAL